MFAKDLNFPTGIAFQGSGENFRVLVIQSGTGLLGACNNNELPAFGGKFSPRNPFTPDVVIFDKTGQRIASGLFKPTPNGSGFQPDGPAIDLAFEHGFRGGRLFASDSNQGVRGAMSLTPCSISGWGSVSEESHLSVVIPVVGQELDDVGRPSDTSGQRSSLGQRARAASTCQVDDDFDHDTRAQDPHRMIKTLKPVLHHQRSCHGMALPGSALLSGQSSQACPLPERVESFLR